MPENDLPRLPDAARSALFFPVPDFRLPIPDDLQRNILRSPAGSPKIPDGGKEISPHSAHSPQEKRYRWNKQSVRRPLTSSQHSPGSRPEDRRTVLHGPDSTRFWHSHPFGTFPLRNTAHPPRSRQRIPGTPGQAETGPYLSRPHFPLRAARYSGTGSSRGPDGSHCRLEGLSRPFFLRGGLIFPREPRRDPGSALRVSVQVPPRQTWHSVPGYNRHRPHGTDGVPGASLPHNRILLSPREPSEVPEGKLPVGFPDPGFPHFPA